MSQSGKTPLQPLQPNTFPKQTTTPAILRTRRLRQQFSSPTDSILSPCSQRLLARCEEQRDLYKGLLKSKLQTSHIPIQLDDSALDKENVQQLPLPKEF